MKRCKKCLMPDTRPGSQFDEEGVCLACNNYAKRPVVDWSIRDRELRVLAQSVQVNRTSLSDYDCAIAVSGGKDSHYITKILVEDMGLKCLLITAGDSFTLTKAGAHNIRNLREVFNCDQIQFKISDDLFRRTVDKSFRSNGWPLRFIESVIYTMPVKIAYKMGVPLIFYGENGSYDYGATNEETASALDHVYRNHESLKDPYWSYGPIGIEDEEIVPLLLPPREELEKQLQVQFMGYYKPWDSVHHLEVARRYGFHDLAHEWDREGYQDNFEQIDSVAYLMQLWMKYPVFGFQRVADIVSRRIRQGRLGLEEGKKIIRENDPILDQLALRDFCNLLKYSEKEFWDIVEFHWNRDIFEKVDGVWKMKEEFLP